jgi:hypothetical protein
MKSITKRIVSASVLFYALTVGAMSSAVAAPWADFALHNNSSHSLIMFQTLENGKWGKNWFDKGTKVKPGEVFDMHFGHNEGPCTITFHVEADDGFKYDYEADFCKAHNLYITNSTVKWD